MIEKFKKSLTKPVLALVITGLSLAGFGVVQANVVAAGSPYKIEGVVIQLGPNLIKVEDVDGNIKTFSRDGNTNYVPTGASIEVGDTVFVRGEKVEGKDRPLAKLVRKLKDKDGDGYGYGSECTPANVNRSEVTKKNNDFFTVVRNNITYKYLVTSNTQFVGGANNYAQLEVGDFVEVEGKKCEGKKLPQAVKVFVAGGNQN